jgi:hypothetical protein
MKKMIFSAVAFAVVAVSAVAVAPTTSEAVPSFARQTGASCNSCHFQSIPLHVRLVLHVTAATSSLFHY